MVPALWKQVWQFLMKVNTHLPYNPAIPPVKRNKNSCSHKELYTNVYSYFTDNHQHWKQPICPSMNEWLNKLWHSHMDFYSALKRNELLTYVKTRMNLQEIMLSEKVNSPITYFIIPFT